MTRDRTSAGESEEGAGFARAAQEKRKSLVAEFWEFARHNKKWWLTPIIVILILVGLLVVAASTGAGSLIYPLF